MADGLISMYLEVHAGDYIATMCMESKYEDSPYMTLNSYKRKITRNRCRSSIKHAKDEVALKKEVAKCEPYHEYDRPPIEVRYKSLQFIKFAMVKKYLFFFLFILVSN